MMIIITVITVILTIMLITVRILIMMIIRILTSIVSTSIHKIVFVSRMRCRSDGCRLVKYL